LVRGGAESWKRGEGAIAEEEKKALPLRGKYPQRSDGKMSAGVWEMLSLGNPGKGNILPWEKPEWGEH